MTLAAGTVAAQRGSDGSIAVRFGSVSADASSWFTGSGLALALAQAHFVAQVQAFATTTVNTLATKQSYGSSHSLLSDTALSLAQGLAIQANAYASAVIAHFTANAVIPAAGLLDHTAGACSGNARIT